MTLERILPGISRLDIDWNLTHLVSYLRHFDNHFYRTHEHYNSEADLIHLTPEQAVVHFIEQGWREGRSYSAFLYHFVEPGFYIEAYPELGLRSDGEAIQHWLYHGWIENRDPNAVTRRLRESRIHVFNMGKVGSRAIVEAIGEKDPGAFVVHAHSAVDFARTYPDSFWSYPELIARSPSPIAFVAGVRDPFERAISGFIQHNLEVIRDGTMTLENVDWKQLMQAVCGAVEYVTEWFEHGFFCGMDPAANRFDVSRGYSIWSAKGHRAFVYRQTRLADLGPALGGFLGMEIRIPRRNLTGDKGPEVVAFWNGLLERVRFPAEIVSRALISQFAERFFLDEELAKMAERWTE